MIRSVFAIFAALSLVACAPGEDAQASQEASDLPREEIEAIVRAYLIENPEIIEEALVELQRRRREEELRAQTTALELRAAAIYEDSRTPTVGPKDAPVTIVEFVDYRCSFCTLSNQWVQTVLAEHGDNVRFIFKEYPLRGAESVEAAQAAVAAWDIAPDAYLGFHNAMLNASGPLPSARIDALAQLAGIDVPALRARMGEEDIMAYLEEVRAIGRDVGVRGTPFFVINGSIIPGADIDALNLTLNAALEEA